MKFRNKIAFLLSLVITGNARANDQAISLKDDGSAVVVSVLAIIFLGFFVYLWMTDRKLSRLEKELKEKE